MTDATIRPEDIRWRVSNTWGPDDKKMGMLVGYIDARTAMEALDDLDEHWTMRHGIPVVVGNELLGVPGELTVNGVTRSDVGMPSSQEPIKGAYSDCLKRCAVHFGIGRELYELPKIAVECEVGRNGKVKAPKALPTYRNGRWHIESKYGWVKYDREPDEQPEAARGPARAASTPSGSPPVQRTPEEQELLDELLVVPGMTKARLSLLADAVGVPKGDRANADQLREMLARTLDTPQSEDSPARAGSDAATVPGSEDGGSPPATSSGSEPAPTDEQIEAVTGGEIIWPKPGTPEYKALPSGADRAKARAHWEKQKAAEPEQEPAGSAGRAGG